MLPWCPNEKASDISNSEGLLSIIDGMGGN